MSPFHHRPLPPHSTLLSGRRPRDADGFQSTPLQIWYNHTDKDWVGAGEAPHYHTESDECFIVLRGSLEVAVDGETHTVGPGEYCCFPAGQPHAIVAVYPPVETLMIRAPSVADKVVVEADAPVIAEWKPDHQRWPELLALVAREGQTDWLAFTAEWHQSNHVLVALVEGEAAGFLRYVVHAIGPDLGCAPLRLGDTDLTEAKILAFGVAERFRRRGLGRRLQSEVVQRARAVGCYQVRSRSAADNTENYRLKLSMGFGAHPVKDARGESVYFVLPL